MSWFTENNIISYAYGSRVILYSPIGRCLAVADSGHIDEYLHGDSRYRELFGKLTDYVPLSRQCRVREPEDYTLLTVLPNNVCNFHCGYCYAASGRNGSVLDSDKLHTAIDFFLHSKPQGFNRPLTISFMGGGEPLLSWPLVREAVVYAQALAAESGLRLSVSIITNGSVLTDEMLSFFLRHDVRISVSFELIPEVQNAQRGSYNQVAAHIRKLIDAGIPVQINATITPLNVGRMEEMLHIAFRHFPEVHSLMFEPVTGQSLFPTPADLRSFYDTYIEGFHNCLILAATRGVKLVSFAYLRSIFPLERACPGEFCLTADGYITGCYCVGSPRDALFPLTCYGEVREGIVCLDRERFQNLIRQDVYARQECADCEVRWNCGGGCFHQYRSYTPPYQEEVCRFTRKFVAMLVRYRVEQQLSKEPDTDRSPRLIVYDS